MLAEMKSPLSRLLYASRKRIDTSDHAAMQALMEQAAINNARDGVTGLLTWSDDAFLQLLEGPRSALCRLLKRIEIDPRHDGVMLIEFRAAFGRAAPTWSMAAPNARSRAGLADLTYDQIAAARPDTLIKRLSQVEVNTSMSIMSQLESGRGVITI
jgi:hypothetical protein